MKIYVEKFVKRIAALTVVLGIGMGIVQGEESVDFSTEVLPILSDRCFHCHGPDGSHRKANLRLDEEASAKTNEVIVAGDLKASELWHRITTSDPDELMPPPDSHRKPLTDSEREVIRTWIEQGATWGKHWAFEKPVKATVPEVAVSKTNLTEKVAHPIDAFVRARLAKVEMEAAPRAELGTLLRRVSFDLTGLPPTEAEVLESEILKERFDWGAFVDRKLASKHHGERLAMWWLDAARYSDTDGYQQDTNRANWPWRDWVIDAFNANMPFDQFTIEQFAGDLLTNATPEQVLATGFHRHHMTNGEGGRHREESRIEYVMDRVNTMGTVWMGMTLGCAQCHDHKFDPVSQKDYYSLFAFFNSINETGAAGTGAGPHLSYQPKYFAEAVTDAEAHEAVCKKRMDKENVAMHARFNTWLEGIRKTLPKDYTAWRMLGPKVVRSTRSTEGTTFSVETNGVVQTAGPVLFQDDYRVTFRLPEGMKRIAGWKLEVFPHKSHTEERFGRGKSGNFILTNVKMMVRRPGSASEEDIEHIRARATKEHKPAKGELYGSVGQTLDDDPRKGWTLPPDHKESVQALFTLKEPVAVNPEDEVTIVLYQRSTSGDANIGRFRLSVTDQRGITTERFETPIMDQLARLEGDVPGGLRKQLRDQFSLDDAEFQRIKQILVNANNELKGARNGWKMQKVQVLGERGGPRDSHILVRGVWDAKGEKVPLAVPRAILPAAPEDTQSRLDLANWIVSPENPLTSRVIVNHLWQMMFGSGLVRTMEDFGLQGEVPTHPALLDWLAVELVESGWDIRHIFRLIATSETYRQQSFVSAEMLEADPKNRLLARGARFRLPAWMIRDNALASSGLLNPIIGGPPVKPWQPDGVWNEMFMGRFTYKPSVGAAQYRRTLYAFWRRSAAPTFLFDSSQRRVCEVGIRRTNTPLHALTLWNDKTMLESSRFLAERRDRDADGISYMARRVLGRKLSTEETIVMKGHFTKMLAHYKANPKEAAELLMIGQQEPPEGADDARLASLAARMVVASMLFNLDEAMTHE